MADTPSFNPRTVPHTLYAVRPGGEHVLPAGPRVIVHVGADGSMQECWIQAGPGFGDFPMLDHLSEFNAARYAGSAICNTSWVYLFTDQGFEVVVTSRITDEHGPQSPAHAMHIFGGSVLEKIVSLFPLVGFTTND